LSDSIRITSILGSTTKPGRLHRAVNEALDRAESPLAASITRIDLGEVEIGFADGTPLDRIEDDPAGVVGAIASADAVLLATPVYRGSFTGSLKNLIDLTPVEALQGKPVLIVAMGASDHHSLGVERHLRDVLGFFGALVVPGDVYLTSKDFSDGVPAAGGAELLDQGIAGLVALAEATEGIESLGPDPLIARLSRPR
jgi:FMN reductase